MKHPSSSWQPTASLSALRARAELLTQIRQFFGQRDVLEVDTPLLSHGTVTDVYLDAFSCQFNYSQSGKQQSLFLQTSPEYAMKRLLSAYHTSLFQICKAFRHEGAGKWHNPEFTMLEWYRIDFDHHDLMDEVDALLVEVLGCDQAQRKTYQQVFIDVIAIDPLSVDDAVLDEKMRTLGIDVFGDDIDRDSKLQLLFGSAIEPVIGQESPCFIYDFPASQASLAKLNTADSRVADRFEVYYQGCELANGFNELQNAKEQAARFVSDNQQRQSLGLPTKPVDSHLLEALNHGLPQCAGVALGIDRLLMLKLGASHIDQVLAFPEPRA